MDEDVTKRIEITEENVPKKTNNEHQTTRRVVWYVLGFLEILFAFRLLFRVLGANPNSGFISILYSITRILLAPFNAIFGDATAQGIETASVLEPGTIIGMIVYALIAWGIIKLIIIISEKQDQDQA